jgi:hypothetical protein
MERRGLGCKKKIRFKRFFRAWTPRRRSDKASDDFPPPAVCNMPSATAPGVDPARQLGFIVAWSALNLLACAGFALLVVFGLHARRRNAVLLSFETVFALATGSNALLTWTGAVGSVPTPSGLCLASAALTGAFAVAQGAGE